jgi:hypothetical protein
MLTSWRTLYLPWDPDPIIFIHNSSTVYWWHHVSCHYNNHANSSLQSSVHHGLMQLNAWFVQPFACCQQRITTSRTLVSCLINAAVKYLPWAKFQIVLGIWVVVRVPGFVIRIPASAVGCHAAADIAPIWTNSRFNLCSNSLLGCCKV